MKTQYMRAALLAGCAALVVGTAAMAQEARDYSIAGQNLDTALRAFAMESGRDVVFAPDVVRGKRTEGAQGRLSDQAALGMLLAQSGLRFEQTASGGFAVVQQEGGGPQSESAGGDVDALIVTAQKREEAIQDVPIAISAFTQKSLEEQKIEGGFDLMKAIPNVTFSKSNFSSYNFSIRGVGTKAISATTDPGVAVAFNNTTLVQNRLFEQEYFDVERVEVLRGPQGTLYGRNATSGVINVITAKPDLGDFEGSVKLEAGNYDAKRVVGMMNIPLIEDVLAVRLAGAMTERSGYDYNSVTRNAVNGRDLWSGRVSIGFEPAPNLRANLIWERFREDDNRSRTGKQLCHHDAGKDKVGNTPIGGDPAYAGPQLRRALVSQGCKPGSLYEDEAFGTPNGLALPFVFGMVVLGSDCGLFCGALYPIGAENGASVALVRPADPYGDMMQSRDLRTIASFRDPVYRAEADLLELSVDFDVTDSLTITSQTAYNENSVYSFQDFNRFNTNPVFVDTSQLVAGTFNNAPSNYRNLAPGGYFNDPQLGRSNTLAGFDISQADGKQFSQELRLQSSFDGPLNFSFGANYTKFETLIDYYVFYNLISAYAMMGPFTSPQNGVIDITRCGGSTWNGSGPPVPAGDPTATCPYIDPNPIESINGEGHNYFRSKNPYKLTSKAAFGELYWEVADDLKLTAGLRYTDDTKTFIPVPSQVLTAVGWIAGGTVSRGYPEKPAIVQKWGEWTGRLGLDWKPELPFTDQTMLYAFYSHGYKGGGANPPSPGFATLEESIAQGAPPSSFFFVVPTLQLTAVEYGPTFKPEFVNAFEVGAKNTLLGGAMTFNATAFYYDYTDYQVSQIRDRTAVNENFDATIWGLEFETVYSPTRNLRINANLGYLDSEIADGETSIDTMNRTQGNPNYTVVKPWVQLPSNCVVPTGVVERYLQNAPWVSFYWNLCGGLGGILGGGVFVDPNPAFNGGTGRYNVNNYPELNGGAGIRADLGGNELPNAPHWTTNIGAQYGFDIPGGWRATVRGDAYWQSQSYARVYNAVNDKLRGWTNANLSVWVEKPEWDLKIELYAKNIFDDTPITDAFLNSDDTALTTNVFVLDPRLIGLSVRKGF